ncbi:MAG: hypothetical protein KDD69_03690 [Bdellovibrionales bacterium]|nr:hypothetical protein [Bdellovibrionales bacterium]
MNRHFKTPAVSGGRHCSTSQGSSFSPATGSPAPVSPALVSPALVSPALELSEALSEPVKVDAMAGLISGVARDTEPLDELLREARLPAQHANQLYERKTFPHRSSAQASRGRSPADDHGTFSNAESAPSLPQISHSLRQQAARDRAQSLLEALPHAVSRQCGDGMIIDCNAHFARLVGACTIQDVLQNGLEGCLDAPKTCIDGLIEAHRSAVREQTPQTRLIREERSANARPRSFHLHVNTVETDGQIAETIAIIQDVTDFFKAQHALRESDLRLRTVLSQLPVEVWTTDCDLRLYLGGGTSSAKRESSVDTATPSLYEYFSVNSADSNEIQAAMAALRGESVQFRCRRGQQDLLVRMEPFRNDCGSIVGAVGVTVRFDAQQDESLPATSRADHIDYGSDKLVTEEKPRQGTDGSKEQTAARSAGGVLLNVSCV